MAYTQYSTVQFKQEDLLKIKDLKAWLNENLGFKLSNSMTIMYCINLAIKDIEDSKPKIRVM